MDSTKKLPWRKPIASKFEAQLMLEASQQNVRDIFNSIVSDPNLADEFKLLDKSVTQKLSAMGYYYEELSNLDICRPWEHSSTINTQITNSYSVTTQSPVINFELYYSRAHILLDGFLISSNSVLDTLAHEILLFYKFSQKPSKLYITTIRDNLMKLHPNSKLGAFLNKRLSQPWLRRFKNYRNCTTHVSLIGLKGINVKYDPKTGQVMSSKIRLPYDPYGRPFTYKKNREATRYCKFVLQNIQSFVTKSYDNILMDIKRANNTIPIP
jgi:hypothetical protein